MRRLTIISLLAICASCGVAPQPSGMETVAAFEVPLKPPQERAEFLAIVREAAQADGGHVDVASDDELRQMGEAMPAANMSIHAGVWRDQDDKEPWATIMDLGHIGLVWITFARGEDEALARRFRARTMRDINARWPDTPSLPILDRRTIPLHRDLVRTSSGYELNPSAASRYMDEPERLN